jgi:hypothetical protein
MQTQQKVLWIIFALAAILVGLYPIAYSNFYVRNYGLLASKPPELLENGGYMTAFYMHIGFGGMALLTGWSQFMKSWRHKYPTFHRRLGYVYISSVFVSSIAGFIIALSATGGTVSTVGFVLLAVSWFTSILAAFININYSLTFAAVTLRIYLPILMFAIGDSIEVTLQILAWLAWVPNILVMEIYVQFYYGGVLRSLIPENKSNKLIDDSVSR